ncbi:hypothetical protein GE061_002947 [Apolygus lucorum]|uniref:Chitin-binding type-2 domain-containing protein n=1 Tax=Apolygus lucorum TaxID=248454 RepID=A0A8S9X247_APOLU|nr:hypothetical protein GE061_002947 [Apolygus lucorum]
MMYLSVVGLLMASAAFVSGDSAFTCTGDADYKYPVAGSCHNYYSCSQGSTIPTVKDCSWPALRFKDFDPVKLECDWCWRVDCSATPAPPPTPKPTAAPTAAPTTAQPTTAAPTAKPTAPTTAAPTAKPTEATTAAPTAKPTEATTAAPTAKPTEATTAAPTAKPTAAPTAATKPKV